MFNQSKQRHIVPQQTRNATCFHKKTFEGVIFTMLMSVSVTSRRDSWVDEITPFFFEKNLLRFMRPQIPHEFCVVFVLLCCFCCCLVCFLSFLAGLLLVFCSFLLGLWFFCGVFLHLKSAVQEYPEHLRRGEPQGKEELVGEDADVGITQHTLHVAPRSKHGRAASRGLGTCLPATGPRWVAPHERLPSVVTDPVRLVWNHLALTCRPVDLLRLPYAPKRAAEGSSWFDPQFKKPWSRVFFLAFHEFLCNAWQAHTFRVSFWWRTACCVHRSNMAGSKTKQV